ncbi:uncharacterized protein LOC110045362 [Orbicella faveolata]|uniref:uncharacterized protein LOC110045362 n=1 Tax=Orbicella faveolata TaxID=48498 RepID=UPI0009E2A704|nr:uncharacterized protein LOC110045362 [Orbicella faveolata]
MCTNFSVVVLEYRFSCAAAIGNDTKLDFHGEHRVWDGGTLKRILVSNKALYVVMEDEQEFIEGDIPTSNAENLLHGQVLQDVSASTCAYDQVSPNIVSSGQLQATSHGPNLVRVEPLSGSMNATCTATSGMQIQQAMLEGSKSPTDMDVTHTLSTEELRSLLALEPEPHQHQKLFRCSTGVKRKADGSYLTQERLSEDKLRMQLPQNNAGRQNTQVDIDPPETFVEGGGPFDLKFHSELDDRVTSGLARFGNSKLVELSRFGNKNIFVGLNIPPAPEKKPGVVSVIVTTEEGHYLGETLFTYVDQQEKEEEKWEILMSDREKMGKFFKMFGKKMQKQGKVGVSSDRSMQSQEMLQAFVDVAAQIEDKQFILELPSLSPERIIFETYITQLQEDTTDGSCHGDKINKRFIQKSDTGPMEAKEIKRSELSKSMKVDKAEPCESPCSWILGECLGKGAFCKVHKCFPSDSCAETPWAVKMVKMEMPPKGDSELNHEISLVRNLRHERVVSYYGSQKRDGYLHLFMEFMAGVHKCFPSDSGAKTPWAVKMVKMEMPPKGDSELNHEISLVRNLRHERVVSYYGSQKRDGYLHLFMEFMAGHSLLECDNFGYILAASIFDQSSDGKVGCHGNLKAALNFTCCNQFPFLTEPTGI